MIRTPAVETWSVIAWDKVTLPDLTHDSKTRRTLPGVVPEFARQPFV